MSSVLLDNEIAGDQKKKKHIVGRILGADAAVKNLQFIFRELCECHVVQ